MGVLIFLGVLILSLQVYVSYLTLYCINLVSKEPMTHGAILRRLAGRILFPRPNMWMVVISSIDGREVKQRMLIERDAMAALRLAQDDVDTVSVVVFKNGQVSRVWSRPPLYTSSVIRGSRAPGVSDGRSKERSALRSLQCVFKTRTSDSLETRKG